MPLFIADGRLMKPIQQCMVIDDFEVIRSVARSILMDNGYAVIEAANAVQALEQCQTEMPHIILLDWQTPGMTPVEFLNGLRAMTRGLFPRVIYCTTTIDRADIASVMAAGASEVLEKPFDRMSLLSKLLPAVKAA